MIRRVSWARVASFIVTGACLLACSPSVAPSGVPLSDPAPLHRAGPLVIGETQLVGSEGLSVSPRGSYVLEERDNRFLVLASATLKQVAELVKPPAAKAAIALDARHPILLSPDETLALASYTDASAPGARWVAVNELPSGKLRQFNRFEKTEAMGFASDGSSYFVATRSTVSVFDANGTLRKELAIETAALALGPGSKLCAYTEPKAKSPVKVVDVTSGTLVAEWTLPEPYPYNLSSLAFSPDGTRVAASGGYSGKVHVWEAATGKLLFERAPRDYQNDDVLFASDGSLWSISGVGAPTGWDPKGNPLAELRSFSLDAHSIGVGPSVVAAVDSSGSLLRWDRGSGALIPGPGLRAEASLLKFSADDRVVHLVSTPSRAVASWDSATGKLLRVDRLGAPADDGWLVGELAPENNAAWAMARPKGEAADRLHNGVQPIDGGKRFLRVERNRLALMPSGAAIELPFDVSSVAVSPDGAWALADGFAAGMQKVPFTLFDLRTGLRAEKQPTVGTAVRWARGDVAAVWFAHGRNVGLFKPDGDTTSIETPEAVDALAFSPSGKTIALGCRDGVVRLFDVASRNVVSDLAHPAKSTDSRRSVAALAFSNDGRRLASGNNEGTIVVWNLALE